MNTPIIDKWHVGQAAIMEHEFSSSEHTLIQIRHVTPQKVTYVEWLRRENKWGTHQRLRSKRFVVRLLGSTKDISDTELSLMYDRLQSMTAQLNDRIRKAKGQYRMDLMRLKL